MGGSRIFVRDTGDMNLTTAQRETIQLVERLGASISLIGVCLIFAAWGFLPRVRTIPNTFIFFASLANVGASIACLIGLNGIFAGEESALCKTQAFFLEMFMQSDPWWSFAMAVNVYMVFFMSFSPSAFRKHLWVYCLICYGIPAIPAFICVLYKPNGQPIYGDATLWCWINDNYNPLRIFTYYLPIWACILLSAIIYGAVGYHVFHHRNQLRNLSLSTQAREYGSGTREQEKEQQSYGTVTTEVRITAESSGSQSPPSTPSGSTAPVLHKPAPATIRAPWDFSDDEDEANDDIECFPQAIRGRTPNQHHLAPPFTTSTVSTGRRPPSPPRDTTITTPGMTAPNMTTTSTVTSTAEPPLPKSNSFVQGWRKFQRRLAHLDPVKMAYLRTSFVFAISILVTWTPSSINRVYSLAYPKQASYALNLASAVVLPLQGLWNAVIFVATSWSLLKAECSEFNRRGWFGFGGVMGRPRRRLGSSGDGTHGDNVGGYGNDRAKGLSPLTPGFRHWDGNALESRELTPMPRVSNMRVIRGGSL
ncbi:hypothetical protein B0J18DRAFT_467554 [Chaetomium sp. MPI-SDFR-AT-0129]|nr:hypothetical protein B0J18DRAFT_467554 [Chaetomium sp. MPI-SDFR-AT-0129]